MKSKFSLLGIAAVTALVLCACGGGAHFSVSKLKGTYTIYANGYDSNFNPISVVGSVTLDGKGNVTAGEQDYSNPGLAVPTVLQTDAITGGTITIASDGRGTLTVQPTTAPAETFSIVQVNTKHLLITEFDSNATSAGSMDLQTSPTSTPAGGNSFATLDNWNSMCFGGVVTSNAGNVTGEGDDDETGTPNYDFSISGTVTPPDSFGRGLIDLYDATYDGNLEFAYYVVGPEAFRLIEVDGDTTDFYLAGSMFGQGTAAGAFSNSSLGGNFVFSQSGPDISGAYGTAGQFAGDGASPTGTFSNGVLDVNDTVNSPLLASDISGASYVVSADGYGYATLANPAGLLQNFGFYIVDPAINITDPNSTTGGGGALMTDLDTESLGVGFAVPQTTSSTFAGNYAFNQDGYYSTANTSGPFDIVGRVNAKGSSLTGTADLNDVLNSGLNPDESATGSFTADSANPGRLTAQVTVSGTVISPNNITLYQANSNLLLHVDTDWDTGTSTGVVGTGVLEKQQ